MRSFPRPTRGVAAAAALFCACAAAPGAHAQLALEGRAGIVTPSSAFRGDVPADGGYATEVSLTVSALPFVGVYGAFQQAEFEREGSGSSVVRDRGYAVGLRVGVPTPFIPIDPWIRGGVVSHELRAGGLDNGGDRGLGVEAAAGLRVRVGRGMALTPGVSWTRYAFDDATLADGTVNVEYLRVDVGLRFGF